jgi:hypothetical protein
MYFYSLYNFQQRLLFGNIVASIISGFEARVLADGGTFEAKDCLTAQLTALNNIQ